MFVVRYIAMVCSMYDCVCVMNPFIHLTDCTTPFRVHIRTNEAAAITPNDGNAPTAAIQPRGVCLQYQQLAC